MTNERDYIYTMQRKENQCKIYISRADQEYELNGYHTKEEGRLVQEAARLQNEMAQISDGEERKYHLRRQKELTARMEEIVRDVSPDVYMRILEERKRKDQAAARFESGKPRPQAGEENKKAYDLSQKQRAQESRYPSGSEKPPNIPLRMWPA